MPGKWHFPAGDPRNRSEEEKDADWYNQLPWWEKLQVRFYEEGWYETLKALLGFGGKGPPTRAA